MKPSDIGLPAKFDKWRHNQEACIYSAIHSPKRVSGLSAPTGFGKTAVIIGTALQSGKRTAILTQTRALQDQYLKEFGECGIADIRGLKNYECSLRPDYTCEDGKAARCPYWGSVSCPYSKAEIKVRTSKIVLTNYSKWLMEDKFRGCFANVQQLVCDEAHESVGALASAMQVILHYKEIEERLKVPFLYGTPALDIVNWKNWAGIARIVCEEQLLTVARKIEMGNPKQAWLRDYTHLKNLRDRLMYLATANPRDWIVDEVPDGYQFDPIRPARYAEIKMFCKIPRIIMVSATIRPKTLYMLGFSKERFDFYEYPSDFDPSRCPTYHIPTMRNDHRAQDYSMLYLRSDQIMGQRGDRKGIIHTVSWARRDEILARSKYGDRYVVNNKGESATAAIDAFRACGPPAVLVSPSVSTGVDFPYTDCEYQILLKIPFQDGRSKIVKARQDDDPDYGPYQAMQQLVQTVGRAMRAKDDRAEAYILDDHISWFRGKFGHFAPKTFHQFFREVNIVPPPPPKLIPLAAQTKEKL